MGVTPVVKYPTWVSVVRTEVSKQGANLNDFSTNSDVVSVAAAVWNDRKNELESMSRSEAETVATQEVDVS